MRPVSEQVASYAAGKSLSVVLCRDTGDGWVVFSGRLQGGSRWCTSMEMRPLELFSHRSASM